MQDLAKPSRYLFQRLVAAILDYITILLIATGLVYALAHYAPADTPVPNLRWSSPVSQSACETNALVSKSAPPQAKVQAGESFQAVDCITRQFLAPTTFDRHYRKQGLDLEGQSYSVKDIVPFAPKATGGLVQIDLLMFLGAILLFGLFLRLFGATPGKLLVGLKVVDPVSTKKKGFFGSIKRELFKYLPVILALLPTIPTAGYVVGAFERGPLDPVYSTKTSEIAVGESFSFPMSFGTYAGPEPYWFWVSIACMGLAALLVLLYLFSWARWRGATRYDTWSRAVVVPRKLLRSTKAA